MASHSVPLLRLGLPGVPKELRDVQLSLEEAADSVTRLLLNNAKDSLGKAQAGLKSKGAKIVGAVPAGEAEQGAALLASLNEAVDDFAASVNANQPQAASAKAEVMLGRSPPSRSSLRMVFPRRCSTPSSRTFSPHAALRSPPPTSWHARCSSGVRTTCNSRCRPSSRAACPRAAA